MTLAQAYENLTSKGFIKPLDPTLMSNPIPPTWNLNEYCHFHQKPGHKTDNCFCLKHEIQDLIDNGTLPNPNIITNPNIRKNLLLDHRALPSYLNWVQVGEVEWDCSKLIENTEVNMVEVQEICNEEDEMLKSVAAVWGILNKGMTKLKKRVLEDNVANITRIGKHYKPSFLEKGHPDRNMGEGSKPMKLKGKRGRR